MRTVQDMTLGELQEFKKGLNDEELNILLASRGLEDETRRV